MPCAHGQQTEGCTSRADDRPEQDGIAPTDGFRQHRNAIGGEGTADISTGVENTRNGSDIAVFTEERGDDTRLHEVDTVHRTCQQGGAEDG